MGRGGEPSVPLCLPSGAASPTALHLGWDPQRGAVGLWERGWRRVRGWLGAAAVCGEGLREVCSLQKGWLWGDLSVAFSA